MSLLDRLRADSSRPDRSSDDRPRSGAAARLDTIRDHAVRSHEPTGWLGAALHGMWAALLTWLVVVVPVQVAWVAAAHSGATWGESVRVATDGWLLLHGVALGVPGGELHLLPIGLALLPAAACWWAGRRLGAVVPRAEAAEVGRSLRWLALPVASLGGGYAAVLTVASLLAHGGGVRPVWWQAVAIGAVAPALVGGTSALRTAHGSVAGSVAGRRNGSLARQTADLLHLPARVRRAIRPAVVGVCLLVAVAALTVALALVVGQGQVRTVHGALRPGVVGGALLTLGQIGVMPNLVLWALAWIVGPGFSVGLGTLVSPAASTTGMLPLVPVLGALPAPGPLPAAFQVVLGVPVLVGVVLGVLCARAARDVDTRQDGQDRQDGQVRQVRQDVDGARGATGTDGVVGDGGVVGTGGVVGNGGVVGTAGRRPVLRLVLDAVTASVLASAAVTVAMLVSAGSAGPGLLSAVGPSAWHVGLVLVGELTVGACLGAWLAGRRS